MSSTALPKSQSTFPRGEYATEDDFQKYFASEMEDLFQLALLLTANSEKAEHCVIGAARECMASRSVLRDLLSVWARDAVIRNGIRAVHGRDVGPVHEFRRRRPAGAIQKAHQTTTDSFDESPGILELCDSDRLVYVICELERYSIADCAELLNETRSEIRNALNRAFRQIATIEDELRGASPVPCSPSYEAEKLLDGSCGGLVA